LHRSAKPFDLVLAYPQWQGSGRWQNLQRGAQAAAEICARYGDIVSHVADAGDSAAANGVNRWDAIIQQFRTAQAILTEQQPRKILTAGGDCACDIAIIDYLVGLYPALTVIWVDAHLDANTVETSPSGNFHGMAVAAIMGRAPADLRALMAAPLPPSQFRYVCADVGDVGDWAFQRDQKLSWHEFEDNLAPGPVHIHFDLDALDPSEFPHVAYPDGKLSLEAGLSLVRRITVSNNLVGLTITEFAPADNKRAADGGAYLKRLCDAANGS
jgi:arginase